MTTDEDFLLLVPRVALADFEELLLQDGWAIGGSHLLSEMPEERCQYYLSYRKEDQNLVLTWSEIYFERFCRATAVAKKLNLLKKEDRITLFQSILYEKGPDAAEDIVF